MVISDINENGGNETVSDITKQEGEATFIKADVSQPEECENLYA